MVTLWSSPGLVSEILLIIDQYILTSFSWSSRYTRARNVLFLTMGH